jgi:hypothetical protein
MPKLESKLSPRANLLICTLIAAIAAALIALTFRELPATRRDFYDNIWAPANLLLHGQNPYSSAGIKTGLPTLWLPMALGVLLPLGMLDAEAAARIWFIISVIEVALIVLLGQGEARKPINTVIAALILYLFPATIQHFVLGQFALTAALCLMLAARLAGRGRDWEAAFLLALASSKPQLAFLAGIGLLYFYWRRSGLRGSALFGGRFALCTLVLTLPMLASPAPWFSAWWENMRNNPAWLHPSLFALFRDWLGAWGYAIYAAIAILGLAACIWVWRQDHPEKAMLWTLALTTIIAPYVWSWDFVLLMPLWIAAFARADWRGKLLLLVVYAAGWLGMAAVQQFAQAKNQAFWWVPLWFTLGMLATRVQALRRVAPADREADSLSVEH